jgi:integrase
LNRIDDTPYHKARPLSAEQAAAVLTVIPHCTVQGLRDYAIISAYLYLGRRSSELARLKRGDVFESQGRRWYRWEGKRGHKGTNEMLPFVWAAILDYLRAAGRLDEDGEMGEDEYIFTALRDNATRLPSVRAKLERLDLAPSQYEPSAWPLHSSTIWKLVQKYCRKAGVPPVRVHDLRHTAVLLRKDADIREIAHLLGHKSLENTEIYLRHLQFRPDHSGEQARAVIERAMRERDAK